MRFFIVFCFLFFVYLPAHPVLAKRVALVIGNAKYSHATILNSPARDAQAMANVLKRLGFRVIGKRAYTDLSASDMAALINDFKRQLKGADLGLFYYSGHGVQISGENYIVPVDGLFKNAKQARSSMISLSAVIEGMEGQTRNNLIILDACRNNPPEKNMWDRDFVASKGFAPQPAESGTFIAFAARPGSTARDGEPGGYSPFTEGMLSHIRKPLEITDLMRSVRRDVRRKTSGRQLPWTSSSLEEDIYLAGRSKRGVDPVDVAGLLTHPQERDYKELVSAALSRLRYHKCRFMRNVYRLHRQYISRGIISYMPTRHSSQAQTLPEQRSMVAKKYVDRVLGKVRELERRGAGCLEIQSAVAGILKQPAKRQKYWH